MVVLTLFHLQGSARVIRCLMKTRDRLSPECRAVLFDEEVRHTVYS